MFIPFYIGFEINDFTDDGEGGGWDFFFGSDFYNCPLYTSDAADASLRVDLWWARVTKQKKTTIVSLEQGRKLNYDGHTLIE